MQIQTPEATVTEQNEQLNKSVPVFLRFFCPGFSIEVAAAHPGLPR
jgi:hypothetical protein